MSVIYVQAAHGRRAGTDKTKMKRPPKYDRIKFYAMNIRKYLISAAMVFSILTPCLDASAIDKWHKSRLNTLIRDYKSRDSGFEVVHLGSFTTWFGMTVARMAVDSEDRAGLNALKGVKGITVVDYDDARPENKQAFSDKVHDLLEDVDLLMEQKEEGSVTRMYGSITPDAKKIRDLIVFTPGEGALICLYGTMDVEALQHIGEERMKEADCEEIQMEEVSDGD